MVRENGMVMMSEEEYGELINDANSAKYLRSTVVKMLKSFNDNPTEDIELTRREYIETFNAAVDSMFDNDENEIYGYDTTVHWHGIYCNCEDGAEVFDHIISAIEKIDDEI